ncbi:hypothetical protein NC651_040137 [Populus alba x Populus x berolinensis]|nr:hypothetical protein NC651_040137 [Populus alba x Populus x berolinensis]
MRNIRLSENPIRLIHGRGGIPRFVLGCCGSDIVSSTRYASPGKALRERKGESEIRDMSAYVMFKVRMEIRVGMKSNSIQMKGPSVGTTGLQKMASGTPVLSPLKSVAPSIGEKTSH